MQREMQRNKPLLDTHHPAATCNFCIASNIDSANGKEWEMVYTFPRCKYINVPHSIKYKSQFIACSLAIAIGIDGKSQQQNQHGMFLSSMERYQMPRAWGNLCAHQFVFALLFAFCSFFFTSSSSSSYFSTNARMEMYWCGSFTRCLTWSKISQLIPYPIGNAGAMSYVDQILILVYKCTYMYLPNVAHARRKHANTGACRWTGVNPLRSRWYDSSLCRRCIRISLSTSLCILARDLCALRTRFASFRKRIYTKYIVDIIENIFLKTYIKLPPIVLPTMYIEIAFWCKLKTSREHTL